MTRIEPEDISNKKLVVGLHWYGMRRALAAGAMIQEVPGL
jgi:hypothetical protein